MNLTREGRYFGITIEWMVSKCVKIESLKCKHETTKRTFQTEIIIKNNII